MASVGIRHWQQHRENIVTQRADIEQILAQHITRLQVCLQQASGDSSGPEEGSDAWLLLNALINQDLPDGQDLLTRFEQSGHWLAEQGGKLDVRLSGLQRYVDALASDLKEFLPPDLLVEATRWLYQLQAAGILALTRGYQTVTDQYKRER